MELLAFNQYVIAILTAAPFSVSSRSTLILAFVNTRGFGKAGVSGWLNELVSLYVISVYGFFLLRTIEILFTLG